MEGLGATPPTTDAKETACLVRQPRLCESSLIIATIV
jgi:hypothetical protein